MIGICYADYYLPKITYPAEELVRNCRYDFAQNINFCDDFLNQSRIKEIYIEHDQNEIDLFQEMIRSCLNKTDLNPEEVTHIIYISYPNRVIIDNVCVPYLLQIEFNFKKATIINLFQDCSSVLQAMQIAYSFIQNNIANNVLILSACFGIDFTERFIETTIVGDGLGLFVISRDKVQAEILGAKSIADGRDSYYHYHKKMINNWSLDLIKQGSNIIKSLMDEFQLLPSQIKLMIMQNINYLGYYAYSKFMKINMDKMFMQNLSNGGHLAAVDSIRNYVDAFNNMFIHPSDYFILYASGSFRGLDATNCAFLMRAV